MVILVIALQMGKVFQKDACTLGLGIAYISGNKAAGLTGYWLGGDKSTQRRDIERGKALRREVEEMNHGED